MGEQLQVPTAAVPRFASFRPKPLPSLQNATAGSARHDKPTGTHSPKIAGQPYAGATLPASEGKLRLQNRPHEYAERGDRNRLGSSEIFPKVLVEGKLRDIFIEDRVGDPANLVYGALNRSAIPRYNRSSRGEVLGYQLGKTDRTASSQKDLILSAHGYHAIGGKERTQLPAACPELHKLKNCPNWPGAIDSMAIANFIPLRRQRSKARTGSGHDSRSGFSSQTLRSDSGSNDRRGNGPKWSDNDKTAFDSDDSASDYENAQQKLVRETTEKTRAQLARQVAEAPSNYDAWMELIDSQDCIVRLDRDLDRSTTTRTRAERQSIAEVKVSMYESAIKAASNLNAKERLIQGMMEEGSKIWGSSVLLSRWQSILKETPSSLKLWTLYLDFRQSAFSHFRYEETRTFFMECLTLLRKASIDDGSSSLERNAANVIKVYVVLRLTSLMKEAGFIEIAVATWQALLEYLVHDPLHVSDREYASIDDRIITSLTSFETFWDSEVPRIGEEGALGWARSSMDEGKPFQSPFSSTESAGAHSENKFGLWAALELQTTRNHRRPARIVDDVEDNDPYRVILFSDVRDILEQFAPSSPDPSVIVAGWLAFCGLPPWTNDGSISEARKWYGDPYLRTETPHQPGSLNDPEHQGSSGLLAQNKGLGDTHGGHPSNKPLGHLRNSLNDYELFSDSLFCSEGDWLPAFQMALHEYAEDNGPVERDLVRRTLIALVHAGIGGDSLVEYWLALELQLYPETVKKTVKAFLRNRPGSLRLYNAYAQIEYCLLNEERAESVIHGALSNGVSLHENSQDDNLFLWRTWIWNSLRVGKAEEALERLLGYPDNHSITMRASSTHDVATTFVVQPAILLRAQQALTASRDRSISLARSIHSFLACDLLILLTYLSGSASLSAALVAFDASLPALETRFAPTSSAHELLHQSFARLLYHHATHVPLFRPAAIRDRLAASISLFPHNTILLSIYAWNETRFRIDDRIRTVIKEVVLMPGKRRERDRNSVIPHLFALSIEFDRSPIAGSNNNTIRSTFERNIQDPTGAHCASLWKWYFLFEVARGDPKAAKAVWWRGVQACPWVKALWMMGFQELRNEFSSKELKGLHEMILEKELRLHVDLIDLLDTKI